MSSSTKRLDHYDPYASPSPYEVLGIDLDEAIQTKSKEIGKAYNKHKKGASRLKDTAEMARRIDELNLAHDLIIRPDNRVLIDFFLLGNNLFAEVCRSFGRRWQTEPVPTNEVLGAAAPTAKFDDLVPDALAELCLGALNSLETPTLYNDPRPQPERWPLCHVEL